MAAVTTDIRPRRPVTGRPRHLAVVPAMAPTVWGRPTGSVRVAPGVYGVRRAMAVLMATGVVLMAWAGMHALGGSFGVAPHRASASKVAPVIVEVAPGDTFWSIASRLAAGGDPRPLVDRLVADHGGGVLRVGERLAVDPS